jgi:AraC-like DNA-binding protein
MKQHVEFFDTAHFENNYNRAAPIPLLENFIDFFWETKFDDLLEKHPKGFSDALFPNTGYTYLINLGTPFIMQVGEDSFHMRQDGFLPRHKAIECYHKKGNKLFGIKFRISPVIFQKKINFSEYKGYIFPLSYLMDPGLIEQVKSCVSFEERIGLLNKYFEETVSQHEGSLASVALVKNIMDVCDKENSFSRPVEQIAAAHHISVRTLQRYFENTTGVSTKNALQIMRIRKATAHITSSPESFHFAAYGYYDHSHFYKHLKKFLKKETITNITPHLQLLQKLHKASFLKADF